MGTNVAVVVSRLPTDAAAYTPNPEPGMDPNTTFKTRPRQAKSPYFPSRPRRQSQRLAQATRQITQMENESEPEPEHELGQDDENTDRNGDTGDGENGGAMPMAQEGNQIIDSHPPPLPPAEEDKYTSEEDLLLASVDPASRHQLLTYIASHRFMQHGSTPVRKSARRLFVEDLRREAGTTGLGADAFEGFLRYVKRTYLEYYGNGEGVGAASGDPDGSEFGDEIDDTRDDAMAKGRKRKRESTDKPNVTTRSRKRRRSSTASARRSGVLSTGTDRDVTENRPGDGVSAAAPTGSQAKDDEPVVYESDCANFGRGEYFLRPSRGRAVEMAEVAIPKVRPGTEITREDSQEEAQEDDAPMENDHDTTGQMYDSMMENMRPEDTQGNAQEEYEEPNRAMDGTRAEDTQENDSNENAQTEDAQMENENTQDEIQQMEDTHEKVPADDSMAVTQFDSTQDGNIQAGTQENRENAAHADTQAYDSHHENTQLDDTSAEETHAEIQTKDSQTEVAQVDDSQVEDAQPEDIQIDTTPANIQMEGIQAEYPRMDDNPADDTTAENSQVEVSQAEDAQREGTQTDSTPANIQMEDIQPEDTQVKDTHAEDTTAETQMEISHAEDAQHEDARPEDTQVVDNPVGDTTAENSQMEASNAEDFQDGDSRQEDTQVVDTPAGDTPAENSQVVSHAEDVQDEDARSEDSQVDDSGYDTSVMNTLTGETTPENTQAATQAEANQPMHMDTDSEGQPSVPGNPSVEDELFESQRSTSAPAEESRSAAPKPDAISTPNRKSHDLSELPEQERSARKERNYRKRQFRRQRRALRKRELAELSSPQVQAHNAASRPNGTVKQPSEGKEILRDYSIDVDSDTWNGGF
ncbi:hypothetical protein PHISP_06909 [Aspergillus sp. HF37]|nr:hypothetical protein PHISP_06909 [Aspergillus sp. HF37]